MVSLKTERSNSIKPNQSVFLSLNPNRDLMKSNAHETEHNFFSIHPIKSLIDISEHLIIPFHFPLFHPPLSISPCLNFFHKPTTTLSTTHLRIRPSLWLAQATSPKDQYKGPIELPPSIPSVFATDDDPFTL